MPDAILERYRLGELPPAAREELRSRLERDPGLRERLEALDASDAAILAAHPPADMARAIEARRSARSAASPAPSPVPEAAWRRPPARPWFRQIRFAAPVGFALACGLLLAAFPRGNGNGPVTGDADAYAVRLKGAEAGLAIFRKSPGGAELLPPQGLARPGDTLQIFYHCRTPAYAVIFSVDGSGAVTLHLPENDGPAAALQPAELASLPNAYRLDRAPRLERFFLITSPGPFSSESVLARARASFAVHKAVPDSLEGLDAGFRQYPYTLRKPAPKKGPSR